MLKVFLFMPPTTSLCNKLTFICSYGKTMSKAIMCTFGALTMLNYVSATFLENEFAG